MKKILDSDLIFEAIKYSVLVATIPGAVIILSLVLSTVLSTSSEYINSIFEKVLEKVGWTYYLICLLIGTGAAFLKNKK